MRTVMERIRPVLGSLFVVFGMACALVALHGCGEANCADGTVRQDGRCVLAAESCGPRTVLMDGVCVLEEEACDDARLEAGVCVADGSACSGSTTFDAARGRCVPDGGAACGDGTTLDANGQCIATEEACEFPTVFEDGFCVVGPKACERGAVLDPTTNTCIFDAPNCADGMVYHENVGHCRPTGEVCGPGTTYSSEHHLCLADACDVGDIEVYGLCFPEDARDVLNGGIDHDEEGIAGAGAANEIEFRSEDYPYYWMGRLHAVTSNGTPRETAMDRDFYVFDGDALDRLAIGVFSYGYGPAYFIVTGPNGTTWRGNAQTLNQAARELILPRDGEYTLEVGYDLPESHPYYNGHQKWLYGLVIEKKAWTAPTKVIDVSEPATVTGQLSTVADNFYVVTGHDPNRPLDIRFLPGQLPESTRIRFFPGRRVGADYTPTYEPVRHGVVSDRLFMLVDWGEREEVPAEYAFEARSEDLIVGGTLGPASSSAHVLSAQPFDRIRVDKVSNAGTDRVFVEIYDPSGRKVSKVRLDEKPDHAIRALDSGDYVVQLINKDTQPQQAQVRIMRTRPADVGTLTGTSKAATVFPTSDSVGGVVLEVGDDDWLQLRGHCSGPQRAPVPFELVRADGRILERASAKMPCTSDWDASVRIPVEPNQTYLVRFPSVSDVMEVAVRASRPRRYELEAPPSSELRQGNLGCSGRLSSAYEFEMKYPAPLEFDFYGATARSGIKYTILSHETGEISGERSSSGSLRAGLQPAGKYLLMLDCNGRYSHGYYEIEGRAAAWASPDLGAAGPGKTAFPVSLPSSPSMHYRSFSAPADSLLRFDLSNLSAFGNSVDMGLHTGEAEVLQPIFRLEESAFPSARRQQLGFGFQSFIAAFREDSTSFDFTVEVLPSTDAGVLDEQEVVVTLTDLQNVRSELITFELAEDSMVYLSSLSGAFPDDHARLYDSSGELVVETRMDRSSVISGEQMLSSGTYYLELGASRGGGGPYELALRSIPIDQVQSRDQFVAAGTSWLAQDLQISGCSIAAEVHVFVELDTHVAAHDSFDGGTLDLEIVHPNGRMVVLSEANGRSWDPSRALFGVDATAVTRLDALDHADANGTWTLRIRDNQHDHTHDLMRWGIWLDCV